MDLSRFPRLPLAHLPTPLEPMPRLSAHLGGPNLWIKRDDCSGLSTGGNKTRKLEFLIADALEQGADCVITTGATQSNHVRQTCAAAARVGLPCYAVLEDRSPFHDEHYAHNGNWLLDRLHGAHLSLHPVDSDLDAAMASLAEQLRAEGKKPAIIPLGGSSDVGALGYVNAVFELLDQARQQSLDIDHLLHATGSAGTQAGLVAGLLAADRNIPVHGICVSAAKDLQAQKVSGLVRPTLERIGIDANRLTADHVRTNSDYVGDGYGLPTDGMIEAVRLAAEFEGLLLDPVYTGKAFAALIDLIRRGHFKAGENVVFLHTGGSAALFAYPTIFG